MRKIFFVFVLVLGLWSPAVWAEEEVATRDARVHLNAGILHFRAGRFAAAAQEMEAAHQLRPQAGLMYNLGHCYERMGDAPRAVAAFRAYLDGTPGAADRAEVEREITRLSTALASPLPPSGAGAKVEAEPAPAPLVEERVVLKTMVVYREPPPKAGRTARLSALGLLGLSLAGIAAGTAFLVNFVKIGQDLDASVAKLPPALDIGNPQDAIELINNCMSRRDQAICMLADGAVDARTGNRNAAIVSYSVAGAALAGSLAFALYGRAQDRRQSRELARAQDGVNLSVSPVLGGGAAGVVLGGRF